MFGWEGKIGMEKLSDAAFQKLKGITHHVFPFNQGRQTIKAVVKMLHILNFV